MNDETLSKAEIDDLRCFASTIVPPSAKYGVPGADDDRIFSDILNSIGRDATNVRALTKLRTLAGGPFAVLDATRRAEVVAKPRTDGGAPLGFLTRVVLLCYYRDDRVVVSLGLEARPPFPKGHLLDRETGRCSTRSGPASLLASGVVTAAEGMGATSSLCA